MSIADGSPGVGQQGVAAYVGDVCADDGSQVPMICVMASGGELLIPTAPADRPFGGGHAVRVVLHPPPLGVEVDLLRSIPGDFRLWRLTPDDIEITSAGVEFAAEPEPSPAPEGPPGAGPDPVEHATGRRLLSGAALALTVVSTGYLVGVLACRAVDRHRRNRTVR
ncbi:hypothetical protein [Nocardia mexicana]|uniref:Uncharacterized protein n=1 Tax=Nocardia mexicana TaxID=279262 RepID=A0A370GJB5_9NOCA|nr:hypothetical protein [Nocardia mexicana]RDI43319.1 hypothetical protein DFR68_12282 [Nocardia mexicana]